MFNQKEKPYEDFTVCFSFFLLLIVVGCSNDPEEVIK